MTAKAPHPTPAEDIGDQEERLDEALEESFPASDPPAAAHITGAEVSGTKSARETAHDQAESDLLDEALDESFPASDPPSMTRKHGKDDADPE